MTGTPPALPCPPPVSRLPAPGRTAPGRAPVSLNETGGPRTRVPLPLTGLDRGLRRGRDRAPRAQEALRGPGPPSPSAHLPGGAGPARPSVRPPASRSRGPPPDPPHLRRRRKSALPARRTETGIRLSGRGRAEPSLAPPGFVGAPLGALGRCPSPNAPPAPRSKGKDLGGSEGRLTLRRVLSARRPVFPIF